MMMSEGIPAGLAEMPPGPVLGALLASIDRSRINGHELVVVMQARARQVAHEQAELYADMVEVAYCSPGDAGSPVERDLKMAEFAADEIRAALVLTRRSAEMELDLGWGMWERLPTVGEAVGAGLLDVRRARVLLHGTDHLPEATAREVVERILPEASGLTTGQLAARVRRLCMEVHPDDVAVRYQEGLAERRVVAQSNPDGTADLLGCGLPAERVVAIRDRIERIARSVKTRLDERSLDQVRADVFLDLLDGTLQDGNGSQHGVVDLHIDLATLAGLNDRAAEIPGWGPVLAEIARKIAAEQIDGEWRVTVTDPDTALVVGDGRLRRRPTAAQTRHVQARTPTCVFPGCRMPARGCDLDHERPWVQGGPTKVRNLAPECRHDHILKDHGWRLRRTGPNVYTWTSPLGHTYTTRPERPP